MAMGTTRDDGSQQSMWVATTDLPRNAGHPFYERLNRILSTAGFDAFVEGLCAGVYTTMGRPSLAPGRYFRLLLLGYFEGLDSERAITWRAADSLSLRAFLHLAPPAAPPDHSTIAAAEQVEAVLPTEAAVAVAEVVEVVAAKGYHSNETMVDLAAPRARWLEQSDSALLCRSLGMIHGGGYLRHVRRCDRPHERRDRAVRNGHAQSRTVICGAGDDAGSCAPRDAAGLSPNAHRRG